MKTPVDADVKHDSHCRVIRGTSKLVTAREAPKWHPIIVAHRCEPFPLPFRMNGQFHRYSVFGSLIDPCCFCFPFAFQSCVPLFMGLGIGLLEYYYALSLLPLRQRAELLESEDYHRVFILFQHSAFSIRCIFA